MSNDYIHHTSPIPFELIMIFLFVVLLLTYVGAGITSSRNNHLRKWPLYRYIFYILGVLCAASAIIGPLANQAHMNFTAHMVGHLLLGMLAPLLLVLSAPMTLLLRTLHVNAARRLSRMLKSQLMRIPSHPIVASFLNIGGLWILYTTDLYAAMNENFLLHLLVHLHVFIAGYLFTVSMIYVDPIAHRFSFVYRAVVFVIALAGHGILSKYIYANPPAGTPAAQAEIGGMIMYYGGDAIDMVLIFILCLQWFKATRPRMSVSMEQK
jgi:putative membrane protein